MIRRARPRSFAGTFVTLGLWGAVLSAGVPSPAASPTPRVGPLAIPGGLAGPPGRTVGSIVVPIPESTILALLGVGGSILLAPYLRRKTRTPA